MKKRFLSIALTLCMLLSVLPMTPVMAVEATTPNFSDGTWIPLTNEVTEMNGGDTGAKYYLADDVTINTTITVKGGTAGNPVTLDLNGNVLKKTGSGSVISIESGANLTLTDSDLSAIHKFTIDTNGLWVFDEVNGTETVSGGIITGGNSKWGGGVHNSGTFTMKNGSIIGCKASRSGGGVYNSSAFTMQSGSIIGCTAQWGGGIMSLGTATVSGSIVGCKASGYGGGVQIDEGILTIEGGTISGCEALNGGGVYNKDTFTLKSGDILNCTTDSGAGVFNESGTFTMEAGSIVGCKASRSGGGVYSENNGDDIALFTMKGGNITDCTAKWGGGMFNDGGTFTMEAGSIVGCEATESGGGVHSENNGDDIALFTMNGGSIVDCRATSSGSSVYSEGTLKNTSTTGGGTICYSDLKNKGSIEGKLVEFVDDGLYAWEVVPENGKAAKPIASSQIGWYTETNFENKWNFDTDTVSNDMVLYAGITLTVLFTTTVELGDTGKPGETAFDLAIVYAGMPEEYYAHVTVSGTLTTNGAGNYDGMLTLTGPSLELQAMLCEGAIVQQVNGGEANWTYDDTVWGLLLYNGAIYAGLNDEQEQVPAMQVDIYHATCEETENGPYYELDWEAVYAYQPVDKMTFTNTYTAHDYALNHDTDGHWDECPCGDVQNQEAHKFGEWTETKAPTHAAKGEKERVCSVCDYTETAEIPMPEKNEPPQTGDHNHLPSCAVLLFVSGVLVACIGCDKRKKCSNAQ